MSPHQSDPDVILASTGHRPWALPAAPWLMRQSWYDVLFAHWPVPVENLRSLVPRHLPIDTFDGSAWVGVVPFEVRDARARGLPGVPSATNFLEANVRTYVTVGGKPGVWFFSLDAGSALAVLGARTFFRLRYFEAEMHCERTAAGVSYRSRRMDAAAADLECTYAPRGEVGFARPGTLDHFLTERYCLYTINHANEVWRMNIHHPPWPLQPAEAAFRKLGVVRVDGIDLPDSPPLLHYAAAQHVLIWPPEGVEHAAA